MLAVAEELEAAGTPLGAGPTAKAWATQHILQRCIKRGEKLVIFCQYLTDLDNIEAALQQVVKNDACVRLKAGLVTAVNQKSLGANPSPAPMPGLACVVEHGQMDLSIKFLVQK